MTADFDQANMQLDPGFFLRLHDAAGTTVDCVDGCLWITRDGWLVDIQLEPGQRFCIADRARVIVNAFEPSLARIAAPTPDRQRAANPVLALVGALARRLVRSPSVAAGVVNAT